MKELPILFSTDMVRAILTCAKCGKLSVQFPCSCGSEEFLKTVTRRVIKPQPKNLYYNPERPDWGWHTHKRGGIQIFPKYQKGDLLWVRETYCHGIEWDDCKPSEVDPLCGGNAIWYFADGERPTEGWGKTRTSRFMPKWAARTWLEVLDVRAERLQEITAGDVEAEGVRIRNIGETYWRAFHNVWDSLNAKRGICKTCKGYQIVPIWVGSLEAGDLMQSSKDCPDCNGPTGYGWDTNPRVWRYEFKKVPK